MSETNTLKPIKNYLFSNIKGLLIVLVVLGHLLEVSSVIKTGAGFFTFKAIYSFHMPAFLFISGFFSKNLEKCYRTAFNKYFVPYLVMMAIVSVTRLFLTGKFSHNWFIPDFAAWYLLTLFVYKVHLKLLLQFRYLLPLSVLISTLIGCINMNTEFLSIGRTFQLFPFYLGGYYFNEIYLKRVRDISLKYSIGVLSLFVTLLCYILYFTRSYRWSFSFSKSYYSMKIDYLHGMYFHLLMLILACFGIYLLLNLMSDKEQHILTYLGDSTLSIYLLHPIFVLSSKEFGLLKGHGNLDWILILLQMTLCIMVLGNPFISKAINKVIQQVNRIMFDSNAVL